MPHALNKLFYIFRILYGLFFISVIVWIAIALKTGSLPMPVQTNPAATAFTDALNKTGFMNPLMALSYVIGGTALLFNRTAPLGVIVLAPSVVVILFFHLFLTGKIVWGIFWAAGLALIAWRYRNAFRSLWSYNGES